MNWITVQRLKILTSSMINDQSLSSNSVVLGSLNKVIATWWFSGTGHTTKALYGFCKVGSHAIGAEATLLDLRDHTKDNLCGSLKEKIFP